jgi:4-hydroxybenzoate polyprenyltransferase
MSTMTAARRLSGLLQASHPFPIAAVVGLTALVGLVSADGAPDAGRFALVIVAMLLSQLAIGWTNDYIDRYADAAYQPTKPVPVGLVEASWLPHLSLLALAGALAAGMALGIEPLLLLIGGTACGLVYDFGAKRTSLSWLPYIVALALLPLYVWTALDVFETRQLWLYAVAWPLPVAVHVANALPDIDADRAAGRGGVVVRLGRGGALRLLALCAGAPVALVLLSLLWLDYEAVVLVAMLATYALLLLAAGLAYARRPWRPALAFQVVVAAAVVFATGWLAAV